MILNMLQVWFFDLDFSYKKIHNIVSNPNPAKYVTNRKGVGYGNLEWG